MKLIGYYILVDPQSPVAAEQSSIATFDPQIASTSTKRQRSPGSEGDGAPPVKVFISGLKTGQPMARSSVSSDDDSTQSSLRSPPQQQSRGPLQLTPVPQCSPPTPNPLLQQFRRPLPTLSPTPPPRRSKRAKNVAKKTFI